MKFKKEIIFHLALIFFLSFLVITILFRGGHILGGGEVGAAFYSPLRIFEMIRYAWSDMYLGITSGLMPASAPTFGVMGLFEKLGVPTFLIQASFFLLVLTMTMSSMYFLARELFPNKKPDLWLFAGLIYQFNLYTTLNVWNRFLPNTMLFYAFVPLSVMLFIRGLKENSYLYVLVLAILTAILSYAFAAPAQTLIFWGLLLITALYFMFITRSKLFVIKYFLLLIFSWLCLNFWWFSQQLTFVSSSTFTASTRAYFTDAGNINTFVTISRSLGQLSDLFLLRHGRISRETIDYPFNWPHFYSHPIYEIVGWLVVITVLFVAIKKLNKKIIPYLFFLYTLGIFLSKGNLPPFGGIFYAAFERFFFLQFFRNPFEKLGFITAFSFSLLFGFGVSHVLSKMSHSKIKKIAYIFIFSFILVFNGFPYFTGFVFTSDLYPSNDPKIGIQVQIPDDYKKINESLQDECPTCRYIAFPLGIGEGIYYNWTKGYVGLEQSGFLLKNPGISHNTTLPFYGVISSQLEKLFLTNDNFYKVAALLNSKFILLREDVDYKRSGMRDPSFVNKALEDRINDKDSFLEFSGKEGMLSIYEFSDEVISPKVYAASRITLTSDPLAFDQVFVSDFGKGEVLYGFDAFNKTKEYLKDDVNTIVYKNYTDFEINDPNFPSYSEEPFIFPYVRHTSDNKYFNLILFKEKLDGYLKVGAESRVYWDMLLLGKRLKEIEKSIDDSKYSAASYSLSLYEKGLVDVFRDLKYLTSSLKSPNERIWNEQSVVKIFTSHLSLLRRFEKTDFNSNGEVTEVLETLRDLSVDTEVLPYWGVLKNEEFPSTNRKIYRIKVSKEGDYEVILPRTEFFPESFWKESDVYVQIDDKIEKRTISATASKVSLGKRYFGEGLHEISFNQFSDNNLLPSTEFELLAKDEVVKFEIPITKYSPFVHYNLSFNYDIEYGEGLTLIMENDNDFISKDEGYYYKKRLPPDNYYFGERTFSEDITPDPLSVSSKLIFQARPWNNCQEVYFKEKDKCSNPNTFILFNKPTKVRIKDLRLVPKFPNTIYLLNESEEKLESPPKINFKKINPTRYEVQINGSEEPFLLVFSEAYDTRWKAYISQNPINQENHILVNGYANAWWVDQSGDFDIIIEYSPQKLLDFGYLLSLASAIVAILIVLYSIKRKSYEKIN